MRLIFTKNNEQTVIPREQSMKRLERITGFDAMTIEAMRGGIPVKFDGGEYKLVNDDLSDISLKNFI